MMALGCQQNIYKLSHKSLKWQLRRCFTKWCSLLCTCINDVVKINKHSFIHSFIIKFIGGLRNSKSPQNRTPKNISMYSVLFHAYTIVGLFFTANMHLTYSDVCDSLNHAKHWFLYLWYRHYDLSSVAVLFPRHTSPEARDNTINLIHMLRNYLHYHIKCSKVRFFLSPCKV